VTARAVCDVLHSLRCGIVFPTQIDMGLRRGGCRAHIVLATAGVLHIARHAAPRPAGIRPRAGEPATSTKRCGGWADDRDKASTSTAAKVIFSRGGGACVERVSNPLHGRRADAKLLRNGADTAVPESRTDAVLDLGRYRRSTKLFALSLGPL
jgi:hypothetical protein